MNVLREPVEFVRRDAHGFVCITLEPVEAGGRRWRRGPRAFGNAPELRVTSLIVPARKHAMENRATSLVDDAAIDGF